VTETTNGASSSPPVIVTGNGQKVTIPAAGTVTVSLDNHVVAELPQPPPGEITTPEAPEAPIGDNTVQVTG
jgi:hypothetical protein